MRCSKKGDAMMDKQLQELQEELEKRALIKSGERPLLNVQDAIRLAERHHALYRYAQNGATYELRWTVDHAPQLFQEAHLCEVIAKRLIEVLPLIEDTPMEAKTAPAKAATKTSTTKRASTKKSVG